MAFWVSLSISDSAASASALRPCTASHRGDFWQQCAQHQRKERGQGADIEHPLPAEMSAPPKARVRLTATSPIGNTSSYSSTKRPRFLRACQLADVGRGDRHLAAKADALQSAETRAASCSPRRMRKRGSSRANTAIDPIIAGMRP